MTLWIPWVSKIVSKSLYSRDKSVFVFYTEIQDGREKWRENDFLAKVPYDPAYILQDKNFIRISLSHTVSLFIYLFGVLRRFQHCTGHITMGSWKGRGNQYIQLVKVLYCKLLTNGKQLPALPLEVGPGTEHWPQRCEARVLPLCHHGPHTVSEI